MAMVNLFFLSNILKYCCFIEKHKQWRTLTLKLTTTEGDISSCNQKFNFEISYINFNNKYKIYLNLKKKLLIKI